MGSNFANVPGRCHGLVPPRGLFRGRTSRKRSRTIDQSQGGRAHAALPGRSEPGARQLLSCSAFSCSCFWRSVRARGLTIAAAHRYQRTTDPA